MFLQGENVNNLTTFYLQGFSDLSVSTQTILIVFFLIAYILSLVGNGLIIVIITIDSHLHTPMYFFLRGLSLLEICSINVTVPKALAIFLSLDGSISFIGCATQLYIFSAIAVSECLFLAVMAFDRFIAICHPLRYNSVMTPKTCYQLAIGPCAVGLLLSSFHTTVIFRFPFCGTRFIAHFFCDVPPVLHLSCVSTMQIEIYGFILSICVATIPLLLIFCSYINILYSVFLLRSKEAREKAMSTCSAHLVSVFIFYGTALFVHLRIGTPFSSYDDRMTALFYCLVIPTINPLIYSLKNKDMKASLLKRKVNIRTILST